MATHLNSPDQTLDTQPDEHFVAIPKTSAASQPSNDLKSTAFYHTQSMASLDATTSEEMARPLVDAKSSISNLLKDKEQEWSAVVEKKGPLQLLDLPMDILKEIVKEVSKPKVSLSL